MWPLLARGSVSLAATLLDCNLCPGKGASEAGENTGQYSPEHKSLSRGPDSTPLDVLVLLGHGWCLSNKTSANGPVAISQSKTLAFF